MTKVLEKKALTSYDIFQICNVKKLTVPIILLAIMKQPNI
jgi:hypothetical protein